jgi:hypothetical protein
MENNTKIAIGLAAAVVVGYIVYKSKKPKSTQVVVNPPIVVAEDKVGYPAGLKEGDYVRLGSDATVYLLKNGKKLPITYDWMVRYAGDKWGSVMDIDPVDGQKIPVGETLVV